MLMMLPSPDLVSSLVALGLSRFVLSPTYQAGHILDLISVAGIMVDLVTMDRPLCLEGPAGDS